MSIILYISNELYHYEELHRKQMHLTSIKSQIDSLNNELNKLKINYDILLINTQPHNSSFQHSQKDYNDDNNYNEGKLIIKEQTPKTLISFENEKHYTKLYSTLYSFSPLLFKRKRITSACVHLWS